MSDFDTQLEDSITRYCDSARAQLDARWSAWKIDLATPEFHEVIGGLLARQVSIATGLAQAPAIWNEHLSPILLRVMTDAYITLAWIFKDPIERARTFVLHGLGQEKLIIEHREAEMKSEGGDPSDDERIKAARGWIDSQQYSFLTEVNLGSWSGSNTRKMADEAGCLDYYRYAYTPFSSAVHNMWNHVARHNLGFCTNELHGGHRTPVAPEIGLSPRFLYLAAKYLERTFKLFDDNTGVACDACSAFEQLVKDLKALKPPSPMESHPKDET